MCRLPYVLSRSLTHKNAFSLRWYPFMGTMRLTPSNPPRPPPLLGLFGPEPGGVQTLESLEVTLAKVVPHDP